MIEIKLRGVRNTRDLGETLTKYGKVKSKKLLRSPALDKLTKRDIEILKNDYHLSTIIDLRSERERIERKDLEIENIQNLHMPIFNESLPGITHEKQTDLENAYKNYDIDLKKLYKGSLKGEYLEKISEVIKMIIKLILEEKTVLFHCTAGKDRTGLISAILLLILGADKKTVIEEYLYTNKNSKWRIKRAYWFVKILERNQKKAENIENLFVAKIDYISQLFTVIEEDWNGLENFLENGLHLTSKEIDDFRNKMLY